LSQNGAADSLLENRRTYFKCDVKYIYIANWFPLGHSWKIVWGHSLYCYVSCGEVVLVTATSLLITSLLLSMYDAVLYECVLSVSIIQILDRKSVVRVLTSENCTEHRLLAQYLQCLWGFWISVFLRTQNLLAIIPHKYSTILHALDNR